MITVYGRDDCPWCEQALGILKAFNHTNYKYLKLDKDISVDDFKSKYPNIEYVPLIELNDEYLGGYDELFSYMVEIYGGGRDNLI